MINNKISITLFALILLSCICLGQESINTSGGVAFNGSSACSQSIGQVFYSSIVAGNSISEGVHQPIELSVDTSTTVGSEEAILDIMNSSDIKAYPNPLATDLFVEVNTDDNYIIEILNLKGKMIYKSDLNGAVNKISLHSYPNGIYLIKVCEIGNNEPYVFKIIKTK
ncbi:T9SS type A sorting domain-containing protein [Flavobacteriales bacterium]|nr:T9SS type A sorting domain-containing protein [Flavobacteriales bacterium]